MSYIKPIKGINFKEFNEFTKKYYLTLEQSTLKYNFTKNFTQHFLWPPRYLIRILNLIKIGQVDFKISRKN